MNAGNSFTVLSRRNGTIDGCPDGASYFLGFRPETGDRFRVQVLPHRAAPQKLSRRDKRVIDKARRAAGIRNRKTKKR